MRRAVQAGIATLVGLLLAAPSGAAGVGLSQVVEEAKKPRSEQKVVRPALSETKHKPSSAWEPAPPDHGPHYAPTVCVEPYLHDVYVVRPPLVYYHEGPPPPPLETRVRVGVVGGGGALGTELIEGYASGGVLLGVLLDRVSFDLRGYYSRPRFAVDLEGAFREVESMAGDIVMRIHLAPARAAAGVNLMVSGRIGRYDWRYENPIDVEDGLGYRTVTGDALNFHAVLLGIGIEPVRTPSFSFSITGAAGRQRFDHRTRQRFDNDLFGDGIVYELQAELVFSPSLWSR